MEKQDADGEKETLRMPRKAIVIHSPYSGKSDQLDAALVDLRESGVEIVDVISIATLDHLPPQGTRWRQDGAELAVAAGGDGLVGGVITHIAESGLILGILPLGTANDIARSLRIPPNIRQAARIIGGGTVQEIDIGAARPSEQAPHPASKDQRHPARAQVASWKQSYFAHTVTTGLNVQFARIATNVATRKRFGRLTYPVAALETLRYYDGLDVALQFEGLAMPRAVTPASGLNDDSAGPYTLRCRVLQVTVINAPIFGGQWNMALPNVSLSDRLLDIVVIEEFEIGRINAALARLFDAHPRNAALNGGALNDYVPPSERHPADLVNIRGVHHFQAKGMHIATGADPHDVTLDGEVRGQTPIYAYLASERLKVMGPIQERGT